MIWLYHMRDGEFAFYVVRWKPEDSNKSKITRPVHVVPVSRWARALGAQGDAGAENAPQPAGDPQVS